MSIVRCEGPGCSVQIDTDLDTECTIPDPRHSLAGHPDLIRCTNCRDKMQAELEAAGCGGMK